MERPFEQPAGFVTYPEVCAWYGALTLAQLTGDNGLRERLIRKFDPLLTPVGSKNISPQAHAGFFQRAPKTPPTLGWE